jgi:hypothetical protein
MRDVRGGLADVPPEMLCVRERLAKVAATDPHLWSW